jgi:hypothetical protein
MTTNAFRSLHESVAATAVVAKFASMASYSLADLDAGEIHIFLEVAELDSLT